MGSTVRSHAPHGRLRTGVASLLAGVSIAVAMPAAAQDAAMLERLEALEARFQQLETENAQLRAQVDALQGDIAPDEAGTLTLSAPEASGPAATAQDLSLIHISEPTRPY